jgi:hypothetical protein
MKKAIIAILILAAVGLGVWFLAQRFFPYSPEDAVQAEEKSEKEKIDLLLDARRTEREGTEEVDPFGDDGMVNILLLGVDKRAGQTKGHCDAIQFIVVNKEKEEVLITAVPRGTYSPLPPGGKYLPTDYYISKACEIGGLDYGIEQVEKIVGKKADYLVIVGFSEALGIFRNLDLPTTETLQWLRHRQGYAIGEPQRAHNHSTFIKQMMIKFVPEKSSMVDKALQYIIYKTVQTDLSFTEARIILDELSSIDFTDHPERIVLQMKPAYAVSEIPYAEEYLKEYLDKMIKPVKDLLPGGDYTGLSADETQAQFLEIIEEKKDDPEFILWAFENKLWLQIEDADKRMAAQYDFLERYLSSLAEKSERENIISDYILEMEYYGEADWAERGRELLKKELDK